MTIVAWSAFGIGAFMFLSGLSLLMYLLVRPIFTDARVNLDDDNEKQHRAIFLALIGLVVLALSGILHGLDATPSRRMTDKPAQTEMVDNS